MTKPVREQIQVAVFFKKKNVHLHWSDHGPGHRHGHGHGYGQSNVSGHGHGEAVMTSMWDLQRWPCKWACSSISHHLSIIAITIAFFGVILSIVAITIVFLVSS